MIKSLQSFRLIFAIIIFLHHFPFEGGQSFLAGGPLGVCFFIMLSGFVMSIGYGETIMSNDFNFKYYFIKRLIRLWPLHILCLVCYVFLHPQTILSIKSICILGINMLMLQSWIPSYDVYFSGNAVSWCLCDLMFCYLMFPLIYKLISKIEIKFLPIVTILIIILYFFIICRIPEDDIHAFVYISPIFRLLDFILGIIAYKFFQRFSEGELSGFIQSRSKISITFVEIGVLLIIAAAIYLYPIVDELFSLVSMWWPICFITIIIFSLLEVNKSGFISAFLQKEWLVKLSAISFTFYMIHKIPTPIVLNLLNAIPVSIPSLISVIVCVGGVLLLAWIVNKYFEKPVTSFLSKRYEKNNGI